MRPGPSPQPPLLTKFLKHNLNYWETSRGRSGLVKKKKKKVRLGPPTSSPLVSSVDLSISLSLSLVAFQGSNTFCYAASSYRKPTFLYRLSSKTCILHSYVHTSALFSLQKIHVYLAFSHRAFRLNRGWYISKAVDDLTLQIPAALLSASQSILFRHVFNSWPRFYS